MNSTVPEQKRSALVHAEAAKVTPAMRFSRSFSRINIWTSLQDYLLRIMLFTRVEARASWYVITPASFSSTLTYDKRAE